MVLSELEFPCWILSRYELYSIWYSL